MSDFNFSTLEISNFFFSFSSSIIIQCNGSFNTCWLGDPFGHFFEHFLKKDCVSELTNLIRVLEKVFEKVLKNSLILLFYFGEILILYKILVHVRGELVFVSRLVLINIILILLVKDFENISLWFCSCFVSWFWKKIPVLVKNLVNHPGKGLFFYAWGKWIVLEKVFGNFSRPEKNPSFLVKVFLRSVIETFKIW